MTEAKIGGVHWLLALLFLAAAVLRVSHFDDSRILAERQYRSALIARAEYLSGDDDSPRWRQEIARVSADRQGVLEPPIMETLAVLGYRIVGGERLWVPRLLATVFWLTGGICLFALASRLTSQEAALYATAYFLYLRLGVLVSVSFLPDSLMLMLFCAAVLSLVRHEDQPSWHRLLVAGVLFGLCVLAKPLCIFALAGAFVAVRWCRSGLRGLFSGSAVGLGLFVLVPTLSYYVFGMYSASATSLAGQAESSFVPALLSQPAFWKDTLQTGLGAVGIGPLIVALLGFALPKDRSFRPLVVGLLAGYFVFCCVFTYHVRMAGYYHLQLAIPIALCLGPAVAALIDKVRSEAPSPLLRRLSLTAAAVFLALVTARDISRGFATTGPIVDPAVARAVGEIVEHSSNVVYVSQYYGTPLEYCGELSGWFWPRQGSARDRALHGTQARRRSVEERLTSLGSAMAKADADFRPEYFVVTDFRQYSYHPDLTEYLEDRCERLADQPGYLIFGRCRAS